MTARNFSSTAADTTLTSGVTGAGTTITVAATTGFPAVPYTLAVDAGTVLQEVVLVTSVAGLSLTVTRGYDGTAAVAHSSGAVVRHSHAGIDFREANTHVNAAAGVHGTTGSVVGTSDTQTLTNKTLTGPKVDQLKDTGGNPAVVLSATASAVNNFQFANAATGNGPTASAVGSDPNIDYNLVSKGTGVVKANGLQVVDVSSALTVTNKILSTGTKVGVGNPDASGSWQSYAATWTASPTNPSLGNGTLVASYMQVGKMVDFSILLTMGSTTTYGSGTWIFSLPSTAKSGTGTPFLASAWIPGAQPRFPRLAGTSLFALFDTAGAGLSSATRAWASGDVVSIQGRYEAA